MKKGCKRSIPKGKDKKDDNDSGKIQERNTSDDICNNKIEHLDLDQMITPAHSSFENEHDYQFVLSDIF